MANSDNTHSKVWLITGASTGLGRNLAEHVLASGARVAATARKPEQLEALGAKYPDTALLLPLDVTVEAQVEDAVAQTIAKFGRIDVLVNNAGYGMVGALEECVPDEFRPMFEVNVFGLIRVVQHVLPHMRERGSGHILNLSSIGGLVASPGFSMYNATKFAVEGLSESLAQELKPLGIHVTIVEPGPFRTDFLSRSAVTASREMPEYAGTAGKMRQYFGDMDGKQRGDPTRAAAAMRAVTESPDPPLRLLLGAGTIPRLQGKLDVMRAEVEAWRTTTVGADFPEGE